MTTTEINLVQPTEFEELCNEIAKRNAIRDRNLLVLKKIMAAYEHMRCQLKMEHLPVNWEKIDCVGKNTNLQNDTRTKKNEWPSYNINSRVIGSSRLDYFLGKIEKEYFAKAQPSGSKWESSFFQNRYYLMLQSMLFTNVDLEENLWDPERQRINPEKLAVFIKKYTWTFPPNTQELLDERLKEERKEENDGNQN